MTCSADCCCLLAFLSYTSFFLSSSSFEQQEARISSIQSIFFLFPTTVGTLSNISVAGMPPRRSRRHQPATEGDTIVLQPQGTPAAHTAAPDSDSDDDIIPSTNTSTFMIPHASGMPISLFTMKQLAGQLRAETTVPTAPMAAPGGLHALFPQEIDEMINSAAHLVLHRATSAQNLITPQTDPFPRQLLPTPITPPSLPTHSGFASIVGQQGVEEGGEVAGGRGGGW